MWSVSSNAGGGGNSPTAPGGYGGGGRSGGGEGPEPCRFFLSGGCLRGDACPFSHEMPDERHLDVNGVGFIFNSGVQNSNSALQRRMMQQQQQQQQQQHQMSMGTTSPQPHHNSSPMMSSQQQAQQQQQQQAGYGSYSRTSPPPAMSANGSGASMAARGAASANAYAATGYGQHQHQQQQASQQPQPQAQQQQQQLGSSALPFTSSSAAGVTSAAGGFMMQGAQQQQPQTSGLKSSPGAFDGPTSTIYTYGGSGGAGFNATTAHGAPVLTMGSAGPGAYVSAGSPGMHLVGGSSAGYSAPGGHHLSHHAPNLVVPSSGANGMPTNAVSMPQHPMPQHAPQVLPFGMAPTSAGMAPHAGMAVHGGGGHAPPQQIAAAAASSSLPTIMTLQGPVTLLQPYARGGPVGPITVGPRTGEAAPYAPPLPLAYGLPPHLTLAYRHAGLPPGIAESAYHGYNASAQQAAVLSALRGPVTATPVATA